MNRAPTGRLRVPFGRMNAAAKRFRRAEDGSMIIFSLFLFIVMLLIGGMAVDLMRFEATRTRLQSTLDRAVLAATDLDQTLPARGVVEDYFAKQGLLDQLRRIDVVESINSRQVSASAAMDMNTFFMDMLGFPTLTAPAGGAAIESVSDIEIILVLDVSGSMGENSRLVNLQSAAVEFVQGMFAGDTDNRISIGIVPFNGQVNLGETLLAQYNAQFPHGNPAVNCIDLPDAAYLTSDLSTTMPMSMTADADTNAPQYDSRGASQTGNAYYQIRDNRPVEAWRWCPARPENIVIPPTRDQSRLTTHINGLYAIGATSINAGMRWGLELIDPGSRPMFAQLIGEGLVPARFGDRPYDYTREDTLKVIVLMSDGSNHPEERVNDAYRSGLSPIWQASDSNGYMSIFHDSQVNRRNATTLAASRPFWVPHLSQWHARPWGGTTPPTSMAYAEGTNRRMDVNGDGVCNNTDDRRGNLTSTQSCWLRTSAQQTWPQIWSQVRMRWVAYQMYARPFATSGTDRINRAENQMNLFRSVEPDVVSMNAELQSVCEMARENGVTVFTIAFEATGGGPAQLAQCASSPGHYFETYGAQIRNVFRTIAAQINRLRLIE